ncbi:MAG: hypothetical protein E6R03_02850 [Hyphomicrobiaceae bacterium]|nr:MAG: hypothetical protein E6R03_02850 [Hyphomicrobiaceae bacterium]
MRRVARKPVDAGKEVDSVLSAVRPVLHLAQPKSSTNPDTGKSGEVRAINRPARRKQLSPVEEELREFYQQLEEKTTVQPLLAVAIASAGANSAEVDDTGKLDAALAHGNPIARYIRTRKESEYTDDDYVEVHGVRCLAPERMRRQVVAVQRNGNYVWDLVPDYLLQDTIITSSRMAIVRWSPSKFNKTLPNKFTERMVEHRMLYSPIEVKAKPLSRESIAEQLGVQEADIVYHSTKAVVGSYGTDNLREEGAINLLKNRPELRSMPQRQCTWLEGEDIKKLKKKRSEKSFASAKARYEENRASHAFPSVAMHRPVPQWWWFLKNPNGRSEFRGDENPWPNGIVDLSASVENRKMNHRAMEYMNNGKYVADRWVDAMFGKLNIIPGLEENLPYEYTPAETGSVDDDSETKVETVVTPVPAEPAVGLDPAPLTVPKLTRAQKKELKKLRAANDSDDEGPKISDPAPKKLTKSQRKLAKARQREEARKASAVQPAAVVDQVETTKVSMKIPKMKAFEIARENRKTIDPILRNARQRILQSFLCGGHCAISEETASQLSAVEAPQVLEGDYEIVSEEVIHVGKDGTAGKMPALDREVVKNAVKNYLAMNATRPTSRKQDFVVQVQLDGMPMSFDLEDPRAVTGIEYVMDSITKRIGDLAVIEDLMEELRETAMRLQGVLQPEDAYMKYNSLFATHDILTPKQPVHKQEVAIRKMTLADLDHTKPAVGVILYGHGRCQDPVWRRDLRTPGWKRMVQVEKALPAALRRHENSRRTKAKAAMAAWQERITHPKTTEEVVKGKHYRMMLAREQEIAYIHEKVQVKAGMLKLKRDRLLRTETIAHNRLEKIAYHKRLVAARKPKNEESRKIRGLMHKYSRLERAALGKDGRMRLLMRRITKQQYIQEIQLVEERKLLREHRANAVIVRQALKNRARDEAEKTLGKSLKRGLETLKRFFRGETPKPTSGIVVAPTINDEYEEVVMPPDTIKSVPYTPPAPSAQMAPDEVWMRRATLVATGNEKRIVARGVAYRATDSGLLIPEDQWDSPSVVSMLDRIRP